MPDHPDAPDAPPRRRGAPLRAAGAAELRAGERAGPSASGRGGDEVAPTGRQRAGLIAGVGLGVAVAVTGLVYAVVAVPTYLLAQVDADGVDRPFIRTVFFVVALPAGVLAGVVAGAWVGAWLARGGRLPTDRRSMYEQDPH